MTGRNNRMPRRLLARQMTRSAILAVVVCAAAAMPVAADWVKSDHVVVSYAGIDKSYAEAIARIVETARSATIEQFGFNMPATIRVVVTVAPQKKRRLCNDGRDGILLTIRSEKDLLKPEASGLLHVYGMCHEVGHLAMYRLTPPTWMSPAAAEGWAHYLRAASGGRRLCEGGRGLVARSLRLRKRGREAVGRSSIAAADESDDDNGFITKGAAAWKQLVDIVGDKGIAPIFLAWGRAKYDPANPPGLRKGIRGRHQKKSASRSVVAGRQGHSHQRKPRQSPGWRRGQSRQVRIHR